MGELTMTILNIFASTAETFDWRMATLTKCLANLPDKTYGAPVDYAYYDIINTGSEADEERDPSVSCQT